MILPDEKIISKALEAVYRKWKQEAKKQSKINWKKRAKGIEKDIKNILKGGQKK